MHNSIESARNTYAKLPLAFMLLSIASGSTPLLKAESANDNHNKLNSSSLQIGTMETTDEIPITDQEDEVDSMLHEPDEITVVGKKDGVEQNIFKRYGLTGKGHRIAIVDSGGFYNGADEACFTSNNSCPNGKNEQIGLGAASPVHQHGQALVDASVQNIPDSKYSIVRYYSNDSKGNAFAYRSDMYRALEYATTTGADVAVVASGNMAFTTEDSEKLSKIASVFADRGGVIISSVGNDGLTNITFPAANRNVLAIGATEYDPDEDKIVYAQSSNIDQNVLAVDAIVYSNGQWLGGSSIAAVQAADITIAMYQEQERLSGSTRRMKVDELRSHFMNTGKEMSVSRSGRFFYPRLVMEKAAIGISQLFMPILNFFR